jgi:NADH-quinone oxidoreductase subunit H
MNLVEIVLALIKILIVLLFLLNMAAIATWADRRQGAMVQDRVGPNRAVVFLPSGIARLIVLLPPTLLGVIALLPVIPVFPAYRLTMQGATETLAIATQVAILVTWFGLVILCAVARRSGPLNGLEAALAKVEPRTIFYGGVIAHALGLAIASGVPAAAIPTAARVACGVLAAIFFATGLYTASRVPDGKVALRLAGTLHAIADTIKMVWKEDFVPRNADRLLHGLAPIFAMFPALVTIAVVPFGDTLCVGGNPRSPIEWRDLGTIARAMPREFACAGHAVKLQVIDLNVGILYIFAMAGTGVIGAAIAGWASDNKFSLLGGLRAASQMVSYEVAMGLSIVGLFIIYGSVRLQPMVEWQSANAWGIFVQPVAFILFLVALGAEGKRVPFDAPEGESEIVAGYFVEYSGMKWGMFMTGEYVELIASSALLTTLFFGGYSLPFLHRDGIHVAFGDAVLYSYPMKHLAVVIISAVAFFAKSILMAWVQIFFRWTLPRFRYDQLMKIGWTKLLPLALANMMVTGVLVLAFDSAGPGVKSALKLLADVSQGLVALGFVAAFVALVVGLLEPVERKKFLQSTAARFAAAAGGVKASAQQA